MLERHPSWFKMKLERRELIRQLSPETAVNVLLACWEFLETGERPTSLSPIENIAFATFMPDMEEAWKRYLQRITARNQSTDIDRYHTTSTETEEEPEEEVEEESKKDRGGKPPRSRFNPPTVDEVREYCQERHSSVDPVAFVSFYESKGWMVGKNKMKSWRAAISSWERRDKSPQAEQPPPVPQMTYHTEIINGEEVDVPDGP